MVGIQLIAMDDEQPGDGFSMESLGEDSTEAARQQLAVIEKSLGSPRELAGLLDETYRAAHSLKSAIDSRRMPNVDRLARRLQDIVQASRSGSLAATPQLGSVLASVARIACDALDAVAAGGAEPLSAASAAASLEEMLAHPAAWAVPSALSGVPVRWARVEAARLIAAGEAEGDARAASAAFAKVAADSRAVMERFRSTLESHERALQELREALPEGLVRVARGEPTTSVAAELVGMVNALVVSVSVLNQSLARSSAATEDAAILGTRAAKRAEAAFGSLRSVRLDAVLEALARLVRRIARNAGSTIDLIQEPTNLEVIAARAEAVGALISTCARAMIGHSRTQKTPHRGVAAHASRLSISASASGENLHVQIVLSGGAPDTEKLKLALAAAARRLVREGGTLGVESRKGEEASVLLEIRGAAAPRSRSDEFILARAGETWYAIPSSSVVECIEAGLSAAEYVLDGARLPTLRMNDTRFPREGVVVRTPRGGALLLFDVVGEREFALQTIGGSAAAATAGICGSVRRADGSSALLVDLTVLLPPPEQEGGRLHTSRGDGKAHSTREAQP